MWQDILKYIATTLIGVVITSLVAYCRGLKAKLKKAKTDDLALRNAVKILLRGDIKKSCKYYLKKKNITIEEFEELQEEFSVYEALGGNGTTKILFEKVKKMYLKQGDVINE